ncbi:MAG: response regulator [Crocinitomicaceae bacterium]
MQDQKLKIFIVEDDPFFGNLVKNKISENGYSEPTLIDNSATFLERLLEMPDIVILDFNIDQMNGIDLLRKIKSVNPNIHVILLSAQHEMSVAVNSLKYGAYDYIEKNDSCLDRVLHILDRIKVTNQMLQKNQKLNSFKKIAIVITGVVIVSTLIFALS